MVLGHTANLGRLSSIEEPAVECTDEEVSDSRPKPVCQLPGPLIGKADAAAGPGGLDHDVDVPVPVPSSPGAASAGSSEGGGDLIALAALTKRQQRQQRQQQKQQQRRRQSAPGPSCTEDDSQEGSQEGSPVGSGGGGGVKRKGAKRMRYLMGAPMRLLERKGYAKPEIRSYQDLLSWRNSRHASGDSEGGRGDGSNGGTRGSSGIFGFGGSGGGSSSGGLGPRLPSANLPTAARTQEEEAERGRARLKGMDVVVQVLNAMGVRAADSNGLSDPYCVLRLGSSKAKMSTRVCPTTLNPMWNEYFVFPAEQVASAVSGNQPFVVLEVWDYDGPLAASDFLGQAEVDLLLLASRLIRSGSECAPMQLPLHAMQKGVKLSAGLGIINLTLWLRPAEVPVAGLPTPDGGTPAQVTSLALPRSIGKPLPLVMHAGGNTLYEEPCFAYALLLVHEVRNLGMRPPKKPPVVAGVGAVAGAVAGVVMSRPTDSGGSSPTTRIDRSDTIALRRRGSIRRQSGAKGMSPSHRAGEDLFDDDDFGGLWNGAGGGAEGASSPSGTGRAGAREEDDEDDMMMEDDMGGAGNGKGGAQDLAGEDDPDDMDEVPAAGGAGGPSSSVGELDSSAVGAKDSAGFLYYRLRLTANIILKSKLARHGRGGAKWKDPQIVTMPLPMSGQRELKLAVHATRSRKRIGKCVAQCYITPQDVVDQVAAQLAALGASGKKDKSLGMPQGQWYKLMSSAGEECGQVHFAVAFVDQDIRRHLYKIPLLLNMAPPGAEGASDSNERSDVNSKPVKAFGAAAGEGVVEEDLLLRAADDDNADEDGLHPCHVGAHPQSLAFAFSGKFLASTVSFGATAASSAAALLSRLVSRTASGTSELAEGLAGGGSRTISGQDSRERGGDRAAETGLQSPNSFGSTSSAAGSAGGDGGPSAGGVGVGLVDVGSGGGGSPIAGGQPELLTKKAVLAFKAGAGGGAGRAGSSAGHGSIELERESSSGSAGGGGGGDSGGGGGGGVGVGGDAQGPTAVSRLTSMVSMETTIAKKVGQARAGGRWMLARGRLLPGGGGGGPAAKSPAGAKAAAGKADAIARAALQLRRLQMADQQAAINQVEALGELRIAICGMDVLGGAASKGDNLTVVFKCGPHWGRSRAAPCTENGGAVWNWEVHLPVYDASTLLVMCLYSEQGMAIIKRKGAQPEMKFVGKLRIRLNTLKAGKAISCYLPLLSDRQNAVRQSAMASLQLQVLYPQAARLWSSYLQPQVGERMYYLGAADEAADLEQHTNWLLRDWLEVMQPPIPRQVAKQVVGNERTHLYMSRLKVNMHRVRTVLAVLGPLQRGLAHIQSWSNPVHSGAALAALCLTLFFPTQMVPMVLLLAVLAGMCCYRPDAGRPRPMEEDPLMPDTDDAAPEKASVSPYTLLKEKYQGLVKFVIRVQVLLDDIAIALERLAAMFTWADPLASTLMYFLLVLVAMAIVTLGLPFCASFVAFWIIRPPILRTPTPPPPYNIYSRLPTRSDTIA